jgi:hypothetical protein
MSTDISDHIQRSSNLQRSFDSGAIWDTPEETLRDYLKTLNSQPVPNEDVRHREIIRALTINHIQMSRVILSVEETMRRLNSANDATQKLVVRLTWVAVFVGAIQAIAAVITLTR